MDTIDFSDFKLSYNAEPRFDVHKELTHYTKSLDSFFANKNGECRLDDFEKAFAEFENQYQDSVDRSVWIVLNSSVNDGVRLMYALSRHTR